MRFTEATSAAVVTARNAAARDERLKQVMDVITRKLHEAVKELEPTQDEWMEAILFLTRTGQMCNEWRQEFILLSDTLGASMMVVMLDQLRAAAKAQAAAHSATPATEATVQGPYYWEGAPVLPLGV